MRRTDKEISSRVEQDALLAKGSILHLALVDGGAPYIVPLDYGWDGTHIYMHCATKGKKLDCLDADNRVAANVLPFHAMTDKSAADKACDLGTWFQSITVFGRAHRVTDPAERAHGFQVILRQHGADHLPFEDSPAVVVLRIDVDHITAKGKTPPASDARAG